MSKCLRCGAGSEWIQGRVPREPKPSPPVSSSVALVWSSRLPNKEGWWWVEHFDGERNMTFVSRSQHVSEDSGTRWVARIHGFRKFVDDSLFKRWGWPGPLIQPSEPPPKVKPRNTQAE